MRLTLSLYSVRTMTSRKHKGSYLARRRTNGQGSFRSLQVYMRKGHRPYAKMAIFKLLSCPYSK